MTHYLDYYQTGSAVSVTTGGATFLGSAERLGPLPINGEDVSALATDYRAVTAGLSDLHVDVFRQVPFTAAATGRYQVPVAALRAGTHDCTRWTTVAPVEWSIENAGSNETGRWPWGYDIGVANWSAMDITESETDTDSLTIYRKSGATSEPVLIYFVGGGGDVGSEVSMWYDAHRLASEAGIVVLPRYPRGLLGHFYHASLTNGPNYAVEYARAAVKWVYDNIAAFGGDPSKITIGGGSFGGALTLAALEDAATRGRVARALIVSGGGGGDRTRLDATARGAREGYETICARHYRAMSSVLPPVGDVAAWLRGTVPYPMLAEIHDGQNVFPWQDGTQIIYRNAIDAVKNGALDGLDVWIVVAGNEASVLGVGKTSDTFNPDLETLASRLRYPGGAAQMLAESWIDGGWSTTTRNVVLYSAAIYYDPAREIAAAATARGVTVSLTFDQYNSPGNGNDFTAHTSFTGFQFGHAAINWKVGLDGSGVERVYAQDVLHSEALIRATKNFLASGNLNGALALGQVSFTSPVAYTFKAWDATDKAWNVLGVDNVLSAGATAQCLNVDNWRGSMFAAIDANPQT